MVSKARSRRFVPGLDCLQSRAVPSGSGAVITPMDPCLLGASDTTPGDVVITPMDPAPLDSTIPGGDSPAWLDAAFVAGDGLIYL